MPMIEGGEQPGAVAKKHAVAEHIAAHIADADDGERFALDILAQFAKMSLNALPGAARGNSEFFVVIALEPPLAKASPSQKPYARLTRSRYRTDAPSPCPPPRPDKGPVSS